MTKKIRLLIVDDSAFMRSAFQKIIATSSNIEVIGTAKDGVEGVKMCIELEPDIVSMDIEMPKMNGLDAVSLIMEKNPTPIIMVSTLTTEGANATIDALTRGAIDFVPKPSNFTKVSEIQSQIVEKIISIGNSSDLKNRIRRNKTLRIERRIEEQSHQTETTTTRATVPKNLSASPTARVSTSSSSVASKPLRQSYLPDEDEFSSLIVGRKRPKRNDISAILIGISTGGPISLRSVIPKLNPNLPVPVFIVQHMPPNFTKTLAERLDGISDIHVKEAENGELISAGNVYLAPGGKQLLFKNNKIIVSDLTPEGELYSPSVNICLGSLMTQFGHKIVSVIMTGMGHDGTKSMEVLNQKGGYNISQSPNTCVVAGMTSSAIKTKCVHEVRDLDRIAESLNSLF